MGRAFVSDFPFPDEDHHDAIVSLFNDLRRENSRDPGMLVLDGDGRAWGRGLRRDSSAGTGAARSLGDRRGIAEDDDSDRRESDRHDAGSQ